MNRYNKGRPVFETMYGWGTDLDTRRLQVINPLVGKLSTTVNALTDTLRIMEEQNVLSDLEAQYKSIIENERYASDRRGYEIR